MNRLVTFGCSHTFGLGLSDCPDDPNIVKKASQYAWPNLLAKKLNRECVNKSRPGSSNKKIWYSFVKFEDLRSSDIVIILWSHLPRFCVLEDNHEIDDINTNINTKRSKNYYKYMYTEKDAQYDLAHRANHIKLLLDQKEIQNYQLYVEPIQDFKWNQVDFMDYSQLQKKYPKQDDNFHFGIEAQFGFANYMCEIITD